MDKPLSLFSSQCRQKWIASRLEEAETLNQLATPHLQFEAVMALKKARAISPCEETISLPQPKTSFMSNRRWIDAAVLGLAIPLIHSVWAHSPEIKKSASAFAAAQPAVFVDHAPPNMGAKKHPFHPKNENEALAHFMNEPVPLSQPLRYVVSDKPAPLNEQATTDAENAALRSHASHFSSVDVRPSRLLTQMTQFT